MKSLIIGRKPTISRKGISMNPVKYPHNTQFWHWKLVASHIPCTANQSVKMINVQMTLSSWNKNKYNLEKSDFQRSWKYLSHGNTLQSSRVTNTMYGKSRSCCWCPPTISKIKFLIFMSSTSKQIYIQQH